MRKIVSAFALVVLAVHTAAGQSLSDILERVEKEDQQTRPDSFSQLSKQLMPAVVNITTSKVIANDLPMSDCRPNCPARLHVVGPTTLLRPTSLVKTRPIVPLPERRGPTMSMIFCWAVSDIRQYPNQRCSSDTDSSDSSE